jgi:hypothetical protein
MRRALVIHAQHRTPKFTPGAMIQLASIIGFVAAAQPELVRPRNEQGFGPVRIHIEAKTT